MRPRLLTWNIHKGIGGIDRRYRPDRIVEVIRHYEPDVVLLQEVDEGAHHRLVLGIADFAEDLAANTQVVVLRLENHGE